MAFYPGFFRPRINSEILKADNLNNLEKRKLVPRFGKLYFRIKLKHLVETKQNSSARFCSHAHKK